MIVEMSRDEWTRVLTIIGNTKDFPWSYTNPLLMKMGQQLEKQDFNNKSGEMPINIGEIGGVKQ